MLIRRQRLFCSRCVKVRYSLQGDIYLGSESWRYLFVKQSLVLNVDAHCDFCVYKDLSFHYPNSVFVYFCPWLNQWSGTLKVDRFFAECNRQEQSLAVFFKIVVLKNFPNFTEVCNGIKKILQHRRFSVKFAEVLTSIFTEHLRWLLIDRF